MSGRTGLGPRRGERNVQRPLLPAHLLVGLAKEVRLPPPLLEELHDQLSTAPLLVGAFDGADQRNGPLVNQGFEVDVVDGGECEVEQVAGEGRYRGEVAVEEDCVEDCCVGRVSGGVRDCGWRILLSSTAAT